MVQRTASGVVLPGSKSTMRDLSWLRERGFAEAIVARARAGGATLGVCGGFQMLGHALHDPDGVESPAGSMPGLGLLPVETTFAPVKTTRRVQARGVAGTGPFAGAGDLVFDAYEIHIGVTRAVAEVSRPFALVTGTYLHGIFACGAIRRSLLSWLSARAGRPTNPGWGESRPQGWRWDRLADIVAASLDIKAICELVGSAR
jgi:adenosylcobyric acid synthase